MLEPFVRLDQHPGFGQRPSTGIDGKIRASRFAYRAPQHGPPRPSRRHVRLFHRRQSITIPYGRR